MTPTDAPRARYGLIVPASNRMLHFTYSAIDPVAVKSLMAAVGLPAGPSDGV
jgi:hypothetical protein